MAFKRSGVRSPSSPPQFEIYIRRSADLNKYKKILGGYRVFFCLCWRNEILEGNLKLYGFNNLTKSLSFNIYDICYAKSHREQKDYIDYIDEQYNSERLTNILTKVTEMIGARILHISTQDYDPQGASVTILIAEEAAISAGQKLPREKSETILAHLDKSHVTVHTYPEFHPETSIATFRVDIDVSTCGEITPLHTLDFLIGSFDSIELEALPVTWKAKKFLWTVK